MGPVPTFRSRTVGLQYKKLELTPSALCKSSALIEREAAIHRIAYNLVRALMQRSTHAHGVKLGRLSFKGSLDALRHWIAAIAAAGSRPRKQAALIGQLLAAISRDPVPARPGRSEPRQKTKAQELSSAHPAKAPDGQPASPQQTGKKQPKSTLS